MYCWNVIEGKARVSRISAVDWSLCRKVYGTQRAPTRHEDKRRLAYVTSVIVSCIPVSNTDRTESMHMTYTRHRESKVPTSYFELFSVSTLHL